MKKKCISSLLALVSMLALSGADANDDWRTEADQRIAEHRMGELVVTLVNQKNQPIANTQVHVRQQRHAFGFGTAISAGVLDESSDDEPYRQHIVELFNCVVLANGMKWPFWEAAERRLQTEEAVDWALSKGLDVRGHTMIWQTTQFGKPMPGDVWEEVLKAEAGEDADLDYVRKRIDDHIRSIGHHFAGRVIHWDVTNEITEHYKALSALTPDEPPRTSSEIADWYRLAHEADPNAKLFVNDYHILVGDKPKAKDGYESTIKSLLDAGAPLHGIGMQCHYYRQNLTRTPQQLLETLDRFGKYGLPIWITEFDAFGGGWGTGEARLQAQADFFRDHLYACFSHPAVQGYVIWGFWDGRHWASEAPLFKKDWSPKPSLDVYRELVLDKWWTDEVATTDENGVLRLRVFKGEHLLTFEYEGKEYEAPVSIYGAESVDRIRVKPGK